MKEGLSWNTPLKKCMNSKNNRLFGDLLASDINALGVIPCKALCVFRKRLILYLLKI